MCRARSQQLELQRPPELGWVPRQSGFFHRPPKPPKTLTPALRHTHERTHLHQSLMHTHSSTKQAGAQESLGWGRTRDGARGTFRRSVGSRGASNSSLDPARLNPPPVPVPSARESPRRSSPVLSKSDAASRLPEPSTQAGTRSRGSAGTQGARGAAVHRRAAASEIQGAKV